MNKADTPGPAVILLSGGLDSMVTAAIARERGHALHVLTIDYGQRHVHELESARGIAARLGVTRHVELPLDLRRFGGSALTDDIDVPKTGVAGGDIPVTYVPARTRVNALDYSGYPDCRPEFIASFAETARLGTKQGIEGAPFAIHAPLQHMTKADIARECHRLGLDPAWSWSCYDPTAKGLACGACDSCRLRRKGFAEAGLVDTTPYSKDAPELTE